MGARDEAKAATRAKVISAAQKAFHNEAYDEVTLRILARSIGMSTGAIYAQFEDKAALYEAAMGKPAPDVGAFLARVAITCAGYPGALGDLAKDAEALRRQVIGAGSK